MTDRTPTVQGVLTSRFFQKNRAAEKWLFFFRGTHYLPLTFNMAHTPFTRNVPPEKLYESPAIGEAFDRLCYVADRQLFAVVTADSGCGKSTLIRRFAASLPQDKYILLYLSDSKLMPKWFYKGILDELGMESKFYRGDSKRQLQEAIEYIRGVQKKHLVDDHVVQYISKNEMLTVAGSDD